MNRQIVPLALISLFLFVACSETDRPTVKLTPTPTEPNSGIEGVVRIGPACPDAFDSTPCPDAPYEAEIEIQLGEGEETVAVVQSDENGYFKIDLPPGNYILIPQPNNMVELPRQESIAIDVKKGRYSETVIEFDSGIR